MATESLESIPSSYVKGVFISRFDLSFGPTPITRYPTDFITDAQANQLAMQSMVQLNTCKGETVDIVLTMDEIEAIGFGTMGSLPALGFYSMIVFFSIRAPKSVSDQIDKVLGFLADFNAKLGLRKNLNDHLAEELYSETCKLLNMDAKSQPTSHDKYVSEQDDVIMRIVNAMKPILETDLESIEALDIPLAHGLRLLLDRLDLTATSLNLPNSSTSLREMLFEIDIKRGSQ